LRIVDELDQRGDRERQRALSVGPVVRCQQLCGQRPQLRDVLGDARGVAGDADRCGDALA
jgi:hypothetical protein